MDRSWINEDTLGLFIPVIAIIGWATYAIVSSVTRARVRELEVRERMMMIEKGLIPPPEVDPKGFEQRMRLEPVWENERYRTYRRRQGGFTMIAVGLAMMVMFYPNFRIGGFLLVFGVCYLVATMFEPVSRPPTPPDPPQPRS